MMTWQARMHCLCCGHECGHTGVYVSPGVAFCEPCAKRVRDVINIELTFPVKG